jgi:hypothetical protein
MAPHLQTIIWRSVLSVTLTIGGGTALARSASSQVWGLPPLPHYLLFSRAGLALTGSLVETNPDEASPGAALTANTLLGPVEIGAHLSALFPPNGPSPLWEYGLTVAPAQYLLLGAARSNVAGTVHWHLPVGLSLPLVGCINHPYAWVVWAAGRRDFDRVVPPSGSSAGDDAWGYSLGILYHRRKGWGVEVALDQTTRAHHPATLTAGLRVGLRQLPSDRTTDVVPVPTSGNCFWFLPFPPD